MPFSVQKTYLLTLRSTEARLASIGAAPAITSDITSDTIHAWRFARCQAMDLSTIPPVAQQELARARPPRRPRPPLSGDDNAITAFFQIRELVSRVVYFLPYESAVTALRVSRTFYAAAVPLAYGCVRGRQLRKISNGLKKWIKTVRINTEDLDDGNGGYGPEFDRRDLDGMRAPRLIVDAYCSNFVAAGPGHRAPFMVCADMDILKSAACHGGLPFAHMCPRMFCDTDNLVFFCPWWYRPCCAGPPPPAPVPPPRPSKRVTIVCYLAQSPPPYVADPDPFEFLPAECLDLPEGSWMATILGWADRTVTFVGLEDADPSAGPAFFAERHARERHARATFMRELDREIAEPEATLWKHLDATESVAVYKERFQSRVRFVTLKDWLETSPNEWRHALDDEFVGAYLNEYYRLEQLEKLQSESPSP